MRSFKTEGIIIKRRDFKDADRIITVLTPNYGKLVIRANGIRKIPSKRSAHVELLNHCTLSLYQGSAFPVLTEAQTLDSFFMIKEDLQKIGLAYHFCELIDGLCPEGQENRAVFDLLKDMLLWITNYELRITEERGADELIRMVRNFEVELLSLLGYVNKQSLLAEQMDMDHFVENILERTLKSKRIFAKL